MLSHSKSFRFLFKCQFRSGTAVFTALDHVKTMLAHDRLTMLTRLGFTIAVIGLCAAPFRGAAEDLGPVDISHTIPLLISSELYVEVRLDTPLKISKLRAGDQISGKLLQDVYSGSPIYFLQRVLFNSSWIASNVARGSRMIIGHG